MKFHFGLIPCLLAASICAAPKEDPNAGQIAELQKKIAEYKEKTAKVNEKIAAAKSETAAEQDAHERYRKSFAEELALLQKEKNELASDKAKLTRSADSLAQKISTIQQKTGEYTLRQELFRKSIAETIDEYLSAVREIPAPILSKELQSLLFLKSEVVSGAVSGVEGVERLWQVITTVNRNRLAMDSWSAGSVYEKIPGQVQYLRIGFAWIAMASEDGSSAAVWNGAKWEDVTVPAERAAISTAVKIRAGNAVPVLVSLPVSDEKGAAK